MESHSAKKKKKKKKAKQSKEDERAERYFYMMTQSLDGLPADVVAGSSLAMDAFG